MTNRLYFYQECPSCWLLLDGRRRIIPSHGCVDIEKASEQWVPGRYRDGMTEPKSTSVSRGDLAFFVITFGTTDYGDKYVVRQHTVKPDGTIVVDIDPIIVVEKLQFARERVRRYCRVEQHIPRDMFDDPVVVETWV